MIDPGYFGQVIKAIESRGVGRAEIAEKLQVQSPSVSHIKKGRAFPADDKLHVLAELTGGAYSAADMLAAKHAILLQEKGIDVTDFAIRALRLVKQ